MSRRTRHGRSPSPHAHRPARPHAGGSGPRGESPLASSQPPAAPSRSAAGSAPRAGLEPEVRAGAEVLPRRSPAPERHLEAAPDAPSVPAAPRPGGPDRTEEAHLRRHDAPVGPSPDVRLAAPDPVPSHPDDDAERRATCTTAQLRRFIKSRPWVPMHELRRRFGINGADDDVTPISVGDARLFVGLPSPEGQVLAELLRGGDVGYELSVDPWTPVVIGVYPMRPVPRG